MHLMEASDVINVCTSHIHFLLYLGKCLNFVATSDLGEVPAALLKCHTSDLSFFWFWAVCASDV